MRRISDLFTPGLEMIIGPMFSGKTTKLIEKMNPLLHGQDSVRFGFFKPSVDTRDGSSVHSRAIKNSYDAVMIPYDKPELLLDYVNSLDVFAIDEAPFFSDNLVPVLHKLKNADKKIYFVGLDKDFRGVPFKNVVLVQQHLANDITRLSAACMFKNGNNSSCNALADYTQRLVDGQPADFYDPTVIIEHQDRVVKYEARCSAHHFVTNRPADWYMILYFNDLFREPVYIP